MQTIEIHHTVKGRPDIEPIIERYALVTDESGGHGQMYPIARIVGLVPNRGFLGYSCAEVRCPLCGDTHGHGDRTESFYAPNEPGHRVADCGLGGYFIEALPTDEQETI